VGALGEELFEPLRRLRDRIRARDSDHVEAVLARGLRERGAQLRVIAQKSRLA
jgi:hypothetical protein